MHILIFKTNVNSTKDLQGVEKVISNIPHIVFWNVDQEDKDKVMRIGSSVNNKEEIITRVKMMGYFCEELMN
jgi:hypothetical protein